MECVRGEPQHYATNPSEDSMPIFTRSIPFVVVASVALAPSAASATNFGVDAPSLRQHLHFGIDAAAEATKPARDVARLRSSLGDGRATLMLSLEGGRLEAPRECLSSEHEGG